MNKTINLLINLLLQIIIISGITIQNAQCNLDRNELVKNKLNLINNNFNRDLVKNGVNHNRIREDSKSMPIKNNLFQNGLDKLNKSSIDERNANILKKNKLDQNLIPTNAKYPNNQNSVKKNGLKANNIDQNNINQNDSHQNSFNDLIQFKFEAINNYLQLNLIDLNSKLSDYFSKLNGYLSFYSLIDQAEVEKIQLNVCLANRTDVCWHVEDSIITIDLDYDLNTEFAGRSIKWFTNDYNLSSTLTNLNFNLLTLRSLNLTTLNTFNLNTFNTLNINTSFFISYLDRLNTDELKNILICFNLFMPFICSAFLFLLCIQNQHRRKLVELNQLFRKIECVSGLQQIKEDMKTLAKVIDELKFDAKQNQELKFKLQQILNNDIRFKKLDLNGNQILTSIKGDHDQTLTTAFNEQIVYINQQLKLNQLEQSKLKYMVCKTIESFDRILNKMKNNCELINQ